MPKINRVRDKLLVELKELRQSRKTIEDYNFNFLQNFYENTILIHSLIKRKERKEILTVAYRQYFVFLVSCWETYFRDVFVLVYDKDEGFSNLLLDKFDIAPNVYHRVSENDLEAIDLFSKQFNFQDISNINNAFSDLIQEDNYLQYLLNMKIPLCGMNGKIIKNLSVELLFEDAEKIIREAFDIRHKVVHDANYRPTFDIDFIKKVEALFLLVPQINTHFIIEKFNLGKISFVQEKVNIGMYIFSMNDILADDWQIIN